MPIRGPRIRSRGLHSLLTAWVAGVTLAAGLASPAAAGAYPSPVGAHSMLQLDTPYPFMRAMFAEAAGMHASYIRLDVAPSLIFTSPSSPPDYSGLSRVIGLSEEYHLKVLADLFTIPYWIADCTAPVTVTTAARCGTDRLRAYGAEIAQIVRRAYPVIEDWEVWNEPDSPSFFTGTPRQYAWMLRTAEAAIKSVDRGERVLLGGISGLSGLRWLAQVFSTPGADASHAFDVANIHLRDALDGLYPDLSFYRAFLRQDGFAGPVWVTEHGYPSNSGYQYDANYAGGQDAQAAFLSASIPTLVDAGASEVFVTERDNLGGEFASEGLLGGDVLDPPVIDPLVIEKPAYAAVRALAECYQLLGRDCLSAAPVASPAQKSMPATQIGEVSLSTVSLANPGPAPLELGTPVFAGSDGGAMTIAQDGCLGLLEPDQHCVISLRYAPMTGGAAPSDLEVPSDSGVLTVLINAVAPSVSSLSARLSSHAGAGRVVLRVVNPLSASVKVSHVALRGAGARRYRVAANRCRSLRLRPGRSCQVTLAFDPGRSGPGRAELRLEGEGDPLDLPLGLRPAGTVSAGRRSART
jgi:hypothetical protein